MTSDDYQVLGYCAHALNTGKVRLDNADAIPCGKGWRYSYGGNRFFAAGPVRETVLRALDAAGPDCDSYSLSQKHAIVLYPEFITLADLKAMDSDMTAPETVYYYLTAELPFDTGRHRVRVVIDSTQEAPLSIRQLPNA
jgi:hypothetical protein